MIVGACVVAGAFAIVAGIASWRKTTERTTSNASVASFFVDLPMSHGVRERVGSVAISPDGRTVAFVAQSDSTSHVHVRRVEDLEPRLVPGTNGAIDVAFSPDGSWLTFRRPVALCGRHSSTEARWSRSRTA